MKDGACKACPSGTTSDGGSVTYCWGPPKKQAHCPSNNYLYVSSVKGCISVMNVTGTDVSGVTYLTTGQTCKSNQKCCWSGNTSNGGDDRRVCDRSAGILVCKSKGNNLRMMTTAELKVLYNAFSNSSTNILAKNKLDFCASESGGRNFNTCSQNQDKCKSNKGGDGHCHPNDVFSDSSDHYLYLKNSNAIWSDGRSGANNASIRCITTKVKRTD